MTTTDPAPFGALLLHLRAAAGLTQEQLAARAGLSPKAIAALERGKRRSPRAVTVELLANALGLEVSARAQLVAAARAAVSAAWGIEHVGLGDGSLPVVPSAERAGSSARDLSRHPWWPATELTPLVDRTLELDTTIHSLADEGARLITLTGPAGVGKTRLALAAAASPRLVDRYSDGVTWVDLAPVRDPRDVLGAICHALGLPETGHRSVAERLRDVLREQVTLLVIDNFEQVLSAAAELGDLLASSPRLALLVTSREPLQLRWEQTLRVAPLPVPDTGGVLPPLDTLAQVPSVALFVGRARMRRADFTLTAAQAPLIAHLVAQLDGLPLALELAAARLDVLSLPALTRHLGDRLRLLASAAPDRPERQRSLEAAIGWSYDLLPASERRLFRYLGVFVGRVALDGIAAVVAEVAGAAGAAGHEEEQEAGNTLPRLLSLAEKSLLLPVPAWPDALGQVRQPRQGDELAAPEEAEEDEDEDAELAFGMLETVREYARERLAEEGDLVATTHAHAHYFLALAEQADHELHGPDQRAWIFRLEREQDNLRAALRWLLDSGSPNASVDSDTTAERAAALRLAAALGWFWWRRGYHAEGIRWLEEALAWEPVGSEGADQAVRTWALLGIARLLFSLQGESARARVALGEALVLAERQHEPTAIAWVHTYLGLVAVIGGQLEEGIRLLGEAERLWEALDDPVGLGETRSYLGLAADAIGDMSAAAAYYNAALQLVGTVGDLQGAGFVHCYLGVAEWKLGNLSSAAEHIRAAVRTGLAFRDRWLLGYAAQAAMALVGTCAGPDRQARLLGAADALARVTGAMVAWEGLPGGRDVVELRERLARGGERELAAAYREGRALAFAEAAALALTLLSDLVQNLRQSTAERDEEQVEPPAQHASPLSKREAEVLRLVSQGHSNKAIGRQLFLSPSTINHHLTSVFTKLRVNTRAQAVAEAAQRGFL